MDWVLLLKQFLSFEIFIPIVPIFVAIDVLGILPIFISLTLEMEITARKRVVRQSVLTLLLITVDAYGYFSTIVCLILNLLIVWFVFSQSRRIMQLLREGGSKGIAKVSSLLLAAFAVMMIRTGLTESAGLYLRN